MKKIQLFIIAYIREHIEISHIIQLHEYKLLLRIKKSSFYFFLLRACILQEISSFH